MTTALTVPGRELRKVGIDPERLSQVFDAWVMTDYRWNGWACPAFDHPNALRVMAMVNRWTLDESGMQLSLDTDGVTFILLTLDGMPDADGRIADDDIYVERIEPDAHGLVSIGSHSWVWDEVDPADLCEGHESLRGDKMGETVYCDGTCKP